MSAADDKEELVGFLRPERADASRPCAQPRSQGWLALWSLCAAQAVVILALFAALLSSNARASNWLDTMSTKSPALTVVADTYHRDRYNWSANSPYVNEPSDRVEKAWERLYGGIGYLRLTKQEVVDAGASLDSAQFSAEDGGGYVGSLDSFHQLHCLESLYHYNHPAYFRSRSHLYKMPESARIRHIVLLEATTCHADVSVLTFDWYKGTNEPSANMRNPRQCRQWSAVRDWMRERTVEGVRGQGAGPNLTKPLGVAGLDPLNIHILE